MGVRLASLEPLRERPFRLLFLGRTLSGVGDAIVPVATTFAVLAHGDATDLGIVLGCQFGARVVFLVLGGVWADRLPRQRVMMTADVVRAVVQALLAASFFLGTVAIWQFAVAAVCFGSASAFFNPASTGLVPALVSAARLQQANALLGLARSGIEIAGPALSGLIVATLGFGVVFAVDAVSFVASFACLAGIRLPKAVATGARRTVLADAREGIRVVRERRWMVAGLGCDIFMNVAIGAFFVLGPVVVEHRFDGARDWGLMMTAGAVGGLAGGIVALRLHPARPLRFAYTFAFVTPLQLLALARPLPLAALVVGTALVFLGMVITNTYWTTMEQQHVPADAISRADSLSWFVSLAVSPIAMALVGPVSDAIGIRATLVGAAVIGAVALAGALAVRDLRDLRPLPRGEAAAEPVASEA